MVIFCLQMWKSDEIKKKKRLTSKGIKKILIELIVINEVVETDELTRLAEEVQGLEEAER